MIRIRRTSGDLVVLPADAAFVEISDPAGRPSVLFVDSTARDGTVRVLDAGDNEFLRYCELFNTIPAALVDLDSRRAIAGPRPDTT